jgi:hypothetical protein
MKITDPRAVLAHKRRLLNPEKLTIRPKAIRVHRAASYFGTPLPAGGILLVWPEQPEPGSGFVPAQESIDLVNAGDAVALTDDEVAAFLDQQDAEGGVE